MVQTIDPRSIGELGEMASDGAKSVTDPAVADAAPTDVGQPGWSSRLSAAARRSIAPRPNDWPLAVSLAVGALLAVAALLIRLPGFDTVPLWLDEAWRANLVLDPEWMKTLLGKSAMATITSPGYAFLNHTLGAVYASSGVLRLTSLLPGVAAAALAMPIVGRLTGSKLLGCGAALVLALNPTLIQYSNEFKPYALELCIHMILIYLALRAAQKIRAGEKLSRRFLWTVLCAGPIATLMSANIVFILPGYYSVLGLTQLLSTRRLPIAFAGSALVAIVLLGAQYVLLWSGDGRDGLTSFWRDNFYSGDDRASWTLARLKEILTASFDTRPSVTMTGSDKPISGAMLGTLREGFFIASALCAVLGIVSALDWRRPERFLLVVLPIIGVLMANLISFWPLGAVRPNVFLYGYFVLLCFMGLGLAASFNRWLRIGAGAVVSLWFIVLSFPDDAAYFKLNTRPPVEDATSALHVLAKDLASNCAAPAPVYSTPAASHVVRYYTTFDTRVRHGVTGDIFDRCGRFGTVPAEAYSNVPGFTEGVRERLAADPVIWVFWSHLVEAEVQQMIDAVSSFADVERTADYTGAGVLKMSRKAAEAAPAPPP